MAAIDDLVSNLKNAVTNVGSLVTALKGSFPQVSGTASSATGGSSPLPPNPSGFINVTLPNGAAARIPYYGPNTGTGGFVTSVALSLPTSVFTVAGSPITTAGTFTATFTTQTQNQFFVAPNGGGVPAFRTFTTNDFNGGSGASSTTFWRGDLTWATVPVPQSGLTYLATDTVSSNIILDTTSFTSTYRSFLLVFNNIVPAASGNSIALRVHFSGAVQTSSYNCAAFGATPSTNGETGFLNTSPSFILMTQAALASTSPGMSGVCYVTNPTGAGINKLFHGSVGYLSNTANTQSAGIFSGYWNGSTAAIDGFQVSGSSGTSQTNLTSGSVDVYGVF